MRFCDRVEILCLAEWPLVCWYRGLPSCGRMWRVQWERAALQCVLPGEIDNSIHTMLYVSDRLCRSFHFNYSNRRLLISLLGDHELSLIWANRLKWLVYYLFICFGEPWCPLLRERDRSCVLFLSHLSYSVLFPPSTVVSLYCWVASCP